MATGYRDDDQRAYDSQFHNDDPDMPPNDRYDETEIVAYDIVREGGGVIARVGTARLAAAFLRAEPGASHAEPVIVGALEALIDDLVEAAELVGESPNRAVWLDAAGRGGVVPRQLAEKEVIMTFAHKFTVHAEDIEGVLVARVVLDGVGAWTNYSTHGDAEPIEENSEGEWPVLACKYGPAVAKGFV